MLSDGRRAQAWHERTERERLRIPLLPLPNPNDAIPSALSGRLL